nr:ATP-binding protein [Streptomyces sp. NBC_00857]
MTLSAHYVAFQAERQRYVVGSSDESPPTLEGWEIAMKRASRPGRGIAAQDQAQPRIIRRINRAHLRKWRLEALVGDTNVLLSELVTNAYAHGDAPVIGVRVCLGVGMLHIAVDDGTPTAPRLRSADVNSESGRGLWLVDGIVAEHLGEWGVSRDRKVTWCRLPTVTGDARCR